MLWRYHEDTKVIAECVHWSVLVTGELVIGIESNPDWLFFPVDRTNSSKIAHCKAMRNRGSGQKQCLGTANLQHSE